jgi:acyl-coenzyme A synthetase/AMP-(fatty) acid ligase
LSRFGDATALVEDSGAEVSYAELARRCEAFAGTLGQGRQLILLQAANDVASVVAYLAALAAGHVVILTGDTDHGSEARIVRAFSPSVICKRGQIRHIADAPSASLHPDLALLLPTSGSTGSPKLVRLSRRNLEANADAIVEYLAITAQDRAISSLPFHYSYGMSVLNSHLRAGASVILTDMSVTNPDFWDLFRSKRATSIAGVPHSYELFERIGLRDDPPESLRVMTQAGGRLSPELIKTYAAFGAAKGVRFYAMYGQTEAAPRMAYLPPDVAARNPDCIGVAVPGGSLSLEDESGKEITRAGVKGELVYRGPNVMMGYAHQPEDLARGPEVDALPTGDLALRTKSGLYRIVGRVSRFVKIAGLRIGLDDLETLLAEAGFKAVVAGTDEVVFISVGGGGDPVAVCDFVAQRCGLPIVKVRAFAVAEVPRLPSGKIDYEAVRTLGEASAEKAGRSRTGGVIAMAYAEALGIALPPGDATFASLGGDSLSYVRVCIGIERALGQLPERWETMSIASLEVMVAPAPVRAGGWGFINTEVLIRLTSIFMIMTSHALGPESKMFYGGSNILFAMAGYSLVRFQGETLLKGRVWPPISAMLYRMVLPYLVCMAAALLLWPHDRALSVSGLWLGSVFTIGRAGPLGSYWVIETLFHALLITCGLFLMRPVRAAAAARPFAFALTMVLIGAGWMYCMPFIWNDGMPTHYTVDAWLYVYFLGWGAYVAKRPTEKILLIGLAALIAGVQYSIPSYRELWLTLALSVVLFLPRVKLPKSLNTIFMQLAAASYFIFLMHAIAFKLMDSYGAHIHSPLLRIALLWGASVTAGLAFAQAWHFAAPGLVYRMRRQIVGLRALRLRTA